VAFTRMLSETFSYFIAILFCTLYTLACLPVKTWGTGKLLWSPDSLYLLSRASLLLGWFYYLLSSI
jgi:hypothetical protein